MHAPTASSSTSRLSDLALGRDKEHQHAGPAHDLGRRFHIMAPLRPEQEGLVLLTDS